MLYDKSTYNSKRAKHIIQKEPQIFIPIINNYFFQTKLTKYNIPKKKSFKDKLPKIYKKIIVSPGKNSFFFVKDKGPKFESIIKVNEKGDTIDINFHKAKNKNEKINIISKDKEIDSSTITPNYDYINKGRNIIIKKNNKTLKRLSQDLSDNNVDISIQFTNKTLNGMLASKNNRKLSSAIGIGKKRKNLKEKLFKDLRDINKKINNKDDYLKKNYFNLNYQRHFGDEKYCTLCEERRQKGIIAEHEKGLHDTLSFRNYRNFNQRPLSKLRISILPREKLNNFFRTNNIVDEFKNKYLQFNGLNRTHKFKRNSSIDNLANSRYEKGITNRNFGGYKLNFGRDKENNKKVGNRLQYSTLKYYFNK